MIYRLLTKLTSKRAIAIALFLTYKSTQSLASEYVFIAPPEAEQKAAEIPQRDTDYPLYECNVESETESKTESEPTLDSHDCTCVDCDDTSPEAKLDRQLPPENNSSKQ